MLQCQRSGFLHLIASVDPAFVRRFDMVIEVPIPPRTQRQRIVERACGVPVGAECVSHL